MSLTTRAVIFASGKDRPLGPTESVVRVQLELSCRPQHGPLLTPVVHQLAGGGEAQHPHCVGGTETAVNINVNVNVNVNINIYVNININIDININININTCRPVRRDCSPLQGAGQCSPSRQVQRPLGSRQGRKI